MYHEHDLHHDDIVDGFSADTGTPLDSATADMAPWRGFAWLADLPPSQTRASHSHQELHDAEGREAEAWDAAADLSEGLHAKELARRDQGALGVPLDVHRPC